MKHSRQESPRTYSVHGALQCLAAAALSLLLAACTKQDTAEPTTNPATLSSDRNLAEALLYRWWGIFEAPDDRDVAHFFDDLFTDDVYLNMPNVELSGIDAIRAGFSSLPADNGRSHQLHNVTVTPNSDGSFQLDASFTYQIARPDGRIDAGYSSYRHQIVKHVDGSFRLSELTAKLGDPLSISNFEASYADNRARGTIAQYLGITDLLDSEYHRLDQILSADAEVHGMFDPSAETHNSRGDGVLKGIDEIRQWLTTRRHKFSWVSHSIAEIRVTDSGRETYRADVVIDVSAQPKSGDRIDVRLPIVIELRDEHGRFMTITRIER